MSVTNLQSPTGHPVQLPFPQTSRSTPVAAQALTPPFLSTSSARQNVSEITDQNSKTALIPKVPSVRMSVPHIWKPLRLTFPGLCLTLSSLCHMVPAKGVGTATVRSLRGPGSTPGKGHTWGTGCCVAKVGKPSGGPPEPSVKLF